MWAHTAPETAKRVKSSGQNLDKKKVQSLNPRNQDMHIRRTGVFSDKVWCGFKH